MAADEPKREERRLEQSIADIIGKNSEFGSEADLGIFANFTPEVYAVWNFGECLDCERKQCGKRYVWKDHPCRENIKRY